MLLIAACTQAKRGQLLPERQLRLHRQSAGSSEAAYASWCAGLKSGRGVAPLRTVYKGAYWTQVLELEGLLGAKTRVVSAGLGFVRAEDEHAPYSATFTSGHPDSVPGASRAAGRRDWWQLLGGAHALRLALDDTDLAVVVVPNRYLEVISADLMTVPRERLLVFAAAAPAELAAHLGKRLVRVESRMVRALGTNVGALAPAVAGRILRELRWPWAMEELQRRAASLVPNGAPPLYPSRSVQTAEKVLGWLAEQLETSDPPTSATAALRRFRTAGKAFEQKHFHGLYREAVESMGAGR